jgi:hypothetical protein
MRFGAYDSRFGAYDSRFGAYDSRFGAYDSRFGAFQHLLSAQLGIGRSDMKMPVPGTAKLRINLHCPILCLHTRSQI